MTQLPLAAAPPSGPLAIPFREALRFWVRLGFISFGGPVGQIAIMHREIVERRRWISEDQFLHALNFCMLLPGPEAQQLATYIGWLLHRVRGGLVAGVLFVAPSVFILLGLSYIYAMYGSVRAVAGVLAGCKPVVVALVLEAVLRIGRRTLTGRIYVLIAACAFLGIFFFHVPFPIIVLAAGLCGLLHVQIQPVKIPATSPAPDAEQAARDAAVLSQPQHTIPSAKRALRTLAAGLLLYMA